MFSSGVRIFFFFVLLTGDFMRPAAASPFSDPPPRPWVAKSDEKRPSSSPVIPAFQETLAEAQDKFDRLSSRLRTLESKADRFQTDVENAEKIQVHGDFTTRIVGTSATGLGADFGTDTMFTLSHLSRPYSIFPIHEGSAAGSRAHLDIDAAFDPEWSATGRISAFSTLGESTNALVWGVQAPYFQNPQEGYPLKNNLAEEKIFLANQQKTIQVELGSFTPQHSASYLYAGVPNLTEEGADYLPDFGGRVEAGIKNYLLVSQAFAELYAGRLAQSSPWQTEIYGTNLGFELLGFTTHFHWLTAQNDPATFPAGTSGFVTSPVNQGGGWLDPVSLSPIAVGPQKEKSWGLDFAYEHSIADHPVRFELSYGNSDYKPNTNSATNAKGELYRIRMESELAKTFSLGAEYLNIGSKYSPFLLPLALPVGITLSNFPWRQWPFPVNYTGYYTLQDAQEFPQNRQGFKTFFHWTFSRGNLKGSYRLLSQKIVSQLTNFSNDADIQSLGFYESLFLAPGNRPQSLAGGKTEDWNLASDYSLSPRFTLKLDLAKASALRKENDSNNVNWSAWIGDIAFLYSLPGKWKIEAGVHRALGNGRNLVAPSASDNAKFSDSGEFVKIVFPLVPQADSFLQFRTLSHSQLQGGSHFNVWQLLSGIGYPF